MSLSLALALALALAPAPAPALALDGMYNTYDFHSGHHLYKTRLAHNTITNYFGGSAIVVCLESDKKLILPHAASV